MNLILSIFTITAAVGALICWIIVLIKQFQNDTPVHGIIGILTCGLYTYIWGWMKSGQMNLKKMMLIWTACYGVFIIAYGITFMVIGKSLMDASAAAG